MELFLIYGQVIHTSESPFNAKVLDHLCVLLSCEGSVAWRRCVLEINAENNRERA
jgi:hypothetical protein